MNTSPNPAQVMSTLRMLGDKELAQYASMHKTDPYIFPLAFQESNLRKQMRAQGAAGAAPQGPQPPVNDQALQAMAPPAQPPMPEDVGLGRIAPAGVAHMAGGGIVGFAGGGSPAMDGLTWEELQAEAGDPDATPSVRFANSIRDSFRGERRIDPKTGKPISFGEFMNRANGSKTPANENYGNEGMRQPGPPAATPTTPAATAKEPAPAAKPAAGLDALSAGSRASVSLSQRGGAGLNAGPTGPEPAMPTRTPTDFGAAYKTALDGQNATTSPFAAQRGELNAAAEAAAKRQLEGSQGIAAEQGKLYDKQEGRLTQRSADLEKEGKRNEAMSWITAGLEMMQARGPGLAAIAGGAQKGFSQYAGGLEKLKAAQERIDEAADKVAEARLGSKKEQLGAQREYDSALLAGKKDALADTMAHYNVSRQVATEMLKLQASEGQAFAQMSSQERIAAGNNATTLRAAEIQAAAHRASAGRNQQLEIFMALGKGDPIKGAQEYFGSQQGKTDPLGVIAKYRSSLPDMAMTKGGLSKNSPPEDIMAAIMADIAAYSTRVQGAPAPIQAVGGAKVRP